MGPLTTLMAVAADLQVPTVVPPTTLGCVVAADGLVTLLALADAAVTTLAIADSECTTGVPGPYRIGNVVRLKGTFTDPNNANAPVDPFSVSVKYMDPLGTITTAIYPGPIIRESAGIYHLDLAVPTSGNWTYDWVSTGTGAARQETTFVVLPTGISP